MKQYRSSQQQQSDDSGGEKASQQHLQRQQQRSSVTQQQLSAVIQQQLSTVIQQNPLAVEWHTAEPSVCSRTLCVQQNPLAVEGRTSKTSLLCSGARQQGGCAHQTLKAPHQKRQQAGSAQGRSPAHTTMAMSVSTENVMLAGTTTLA